MYTTSSTILKVLCCLWMVVAMALAKKPKPTPSPAPSYFYFVAPGGVDANNTCGLQATPCATIANALTQAIAGGNIYINLAAGTYGAENCGVEVNSNYTFNSVNITGPAGPVVSAIINCGSSEKRHFLFDGAVNTAFSLNYLSLRKGRGDNGGCVLASNVKSLTLNSTELTGCVADMGGAVFSNVSTYISFSNFTFNEVGSDGGALYLESNANGSTIDSSNFINNAAGSGGAVFLFGEYLYFTNSIVSNNNAVYGGGLYLVSTNPKLKGSFQFGNSNFTYNNATFGGGVYAENLNHTWNIFGAYFANNWALNYTVDPNVACQDTAMEFCYACTAKNCASGCPLDIYHTCSENPAATNKLVYCYSSEFTMCKDPSCKCKAIMPTKAKVLIAVIAVLLVVGVTLVAVDVVKHIIRKRRGNTYTPIK